MLSPKELRNHAFQTVGRNAYRASDVDEFLAEVVESYEQMFRENGEIVKKLQAVADKLSQYKNDEENIRNALLEAQRMRANILEDANRKANDRLVATEEKIKAAKETVDQKTAEIISEAQAEADKILDEAKAQADEIVSSAESRSKNTLERAQKLYDAEVGSIKEEAKKAEDYLNSIKAESAKVRNELIDTYKNQLELLKFVPDFSADIKVDDKDPNADDISMVEAVESMSEEFKDTFSNEDNDELYKSLADLDGIDEYLPEE